MAPPMDRRSAARIAQETLSILSTGTYSSPAGQQVDLRAALAGAVESTVDHPPDASLPGWGRGSGPTTIEVINETTLDAAQRMSVSGVRVVALNFASANHPGGGFLNGARAQEESLARASGLYACIRASPMYEFHHRQRDPLYSAWSIHSPDVPVFRDEQGRLLEAPYPCSFITCPAVNAKETLARDPAATKLIEKVMRQRVQRVLAVAASHAHQHLVLGAWGCGVFGNDPSVVAALFAEALGGEFESAFRRVVFAVLDSSSEGRVFRPFAERFGTRRLTPAG